MWRARPVWPHQATREKHIKLDYPTLDALRRQHPAWRLLVADHAPLIASFLQRVFVVPNVRVMAQSDLVEAPLHTFIDLYATSLAAGAGALWVGLAVPSAVRSDF